MTITKHTSRAVKRSPIDTVLNFLYERQMHKAMLEIGQHRRQAAFGR